MRQTTPRSKKCADRSKTIRPEDVTHGDLGGRPAAIEEEKVGLTGRAGEAHPCKGARQAPALGLRQFHASCQMLGILECCCRRCLGHQVHGEGISDFRHRRDKLGVMRQAIPHTRAGKAERL